MNKNKQIPHTEQQRALKASEVCRRLSIHRNTFLAMHRDNRFPGAFRIGRNIRVPERDVIAIESGK